MVKNNTNAISTFIRTLYDVGNSYLMMSFYKYNLSFRIGRWIEKNNSGYSRNDDSKPLVTSVNYEGASLLYQVAMSIVNGLNTDKEVKVEVQCNNNTNLTFEYKPDQNNQMVAYLTIDKNNQSITFKFMVHTYKTRKDGQVITNVTQSGLGVFAKVLDGYLAGIGADRHLIKLPDDADSPQGESQPASYTAGNNIENQKGNSGSTW